MTPEQLANTAPIDPHDPQHQRWLKNLQGNILSGHGRDHTVHIFLRLPAAPAKAKKLVAELARHVTSAHKQEIERQQYRDYKIPGAMFRSLLLSANGYRKLGVDDADLNAGFAEAGGQPKETHSNFLDGMARHATFDLGDPPNAEWDPGFDTADIDAMLLLADDDEGFLLRSARQTIDTLDGRCEIARVERGNALRSNDGEGIEHFGYVDGRSQPLFLATDFVNLEGGGFGPATREAKGGRIDVWNPFEPVKLVLLPDPLAKEADCFGSYFVFRKLEQNVRAFSIAEQQLADSLGLKEEDRERAGAMVVGRFRDGTPLGLSQTDGFVPAKENNFRFDGQGTGDERGAKCPFHAHIRKTNPRGDIGVQFDLPPEQAEPAERAHRIVRRGITFGERNRHPNAFQALDDLPSKGVGLLFMCYQASIRNQFAFMQRGWANNQDFIKNGTNADRNGVVHPRAGLDPIIGQLDSDTPDGPPRDRVPQTWRTEYDKTTPQTEASFDGFVTMKGGEFFFAPSIPFLQGLA